MQMAAQLEESKQTQRKVETQLAEATTKLVELVDLKAKLAALAKRLLAYMQCKGLGCWDPNV